MRVPVVQRRERTKLRLTHWRPLECRIQENGSFKSEKSDRVMVSSNEFTRLKASVDVWTLAAAADFVMRRTDKGGCALCVVGFVFVADDLFRGAANATMGRPPHEPSHIGDYGRERRTW